MRLAFRYLLVKRKEMWTIDSDDATFHFCEIWDEHENEDGWTSDVTITITEMRSRRDVLSYVSAQ